MNELFANIVKSLKVGPGQFNLLVDIILLGYIYNCFFNKESIFTDLIKGLAAMEGLIILLLLALFGLLGAALVLVVCSKAVIASFDLKD
jgi:hypothetical protein